MPSPHCGEWVHVAVHTFPDRPAECWPALVIVRGEEALRLRVVQPTRIGDPIGEADAEAWYNGTAFRFANPDGTTREGDSWHTIDACPTGA